MDRRRGVQAHLVSPMLENDVSGYSLFCPHCLGKIKSVKSRDDVSPARGDYFFCLRCGGVGILSDRTTTKRIWHVRKPTRSESYEIALHHGIRAIEIDWLDNHGG